MAEESIGNVYNIDGRTNMETLFDFYSRNTESYYGIEYSPKKLFPIEENDTMACRSFIHKHYEMGLKAGIVETPERWDHSSGDRSVHSTSLYLFGKNAMPLFSEFLSDRIEELGDNERDVYYVWYLTALYHDMATVIENTGFCTGKKQDDKTALRALKELDIKYSPYQAFPHQIREVPIRFTENTIKNYYRYRASANKYEHGIIAGYLFFDRFVKNFDMHTMGTNWPKEKVCFSENPEGRILSWRRENVMDAAYAADAIICHNLWMAGKDKEAEYKRYHLSKLLYEKHPENKLSVSKFPLQYMLCFIDTIEPTKRFESLTAYKVLTGISIELEKEGLILYWQKNLEDRNKEFDGWLKNIRGMNTWMNITVEIEKNQRRVKFIFK